MIAAKLPVIEEIAASAPPPGGSPTDEEIGILVAERSKGDFTV
jgi:hypothetical protein